MVRSDWEKNRTRFARIGLIGDIHAEDVLFERALDFLAGRRVELIAATGDVPDGVGSVDRCCELIEERQVVVVRGNHDRWLLTGAARALPNATCWRSVAATTRRTLQRLPPLVELETVSGRALLCHGLGPNDMGRVNPDDTAAALECNDDLQALVRSRYYRWVLNGHSHRRMVRHFAGLSIINAGTLTREHGPGFLEIDFAAGAVLAYDFADAQGRVKEQTTRIPLT